MTHASTPRILIIDNDEGVVRAIATRLEHAGYECLSACTGAQGLSLFADAGADFDVVISDLNMPAGDGVSLAGSIRKVSDVPIIFITGFHDDFRRDLRAIPNTTVVEKPFNASELVDLVEAELVLRGGPLPHS